MPRSRELARALAALLLASIAAAGCARSQKGSGPQTAASAAANNPASPNDGGRIYTTNCATCHQTDGRGVPGAFPPLAGNPDVSGDPAAVIAAVKFGRSGKLTVEGETYDGTMPRWGQLISDEDIAAVVSYIRVSWHNRSGAVSAADVRAVTR